LEVVVVFRPCPFEMRRQADNLCGSTNAALAAKDRTVFPLRAILHYGSVAPASASFDPHRFWSQHRVCRPGELSPLGTTIDSRALSPSPQYGQSLMICAGAIVA
jgi:hypothetical protein